MDLRARTLTRPTSHDEQDAAENWRLQAACVDQSSAYYDPWFPTSESKHAYDDARSVCKGCPVRAFCLKEALDEEAGMSAALRHGMRGGKTAYERAEIAGQLRDSDTRGTNKKSMSLANPARDERRAKVAELALAGLNAIEIGERIGFNEETARRDLNFLRATGVIAQDVGKARKPSQHCGTVKGAQMHRAKRHELCDRCRRAVS